MPWCTLCGDPIEESHRFCKNCGHGCARALDRSNAQSHDSQTSDESSWPSEIAREVFDAFGLSMEPLAEARNCDIPVSLLKPFRKKDEAVPRGGSPHGPS